MLQYIPFLFVAINSGTQSIPNEMVDQYDTFGYYASIDTGLFKDTIVDYSKEYTLNISNSSNIFAYDEYTNVDYKFEVLVSTQPISNHIHFDSDITNLDYYVDNSNVVLYDDISYSIDISNYDSYYIYYDISFKIPDFINTIFNNSHLYFYWSIHNETLGTDFGSWIEPSDNIHWAFSITDYSLGVEYENGYNNGVNDGYNNGYDVGYNNGYDSRQSTIDNLQNQVNTLQDLVDDYREGRISLESLMWTIASLPFESFKQIWNVDLLGVNLGGFALGLMFVGIVLFIWKKFI